MKRRGRILPALFLGLAVGLAGGPAPAETTVAVASNFTGPVGDLVAAFADSTGSTVVPVFGSTGKHFAQITNGAPFAAFLAADEERPRLLEEQGLALPGTRFTYAQGRLVLWSARPGFVDSAGAVLAAGGFVHLALANEKLAPYGQAARQVLEGMGLWGSLQPRLVRGETINQAFQFVQSGNAELGFVAYSQYGSLPEAAAGSAWVVPATRHQPIRQQAVLLRDDPVARAFLEFLKSPAARGIIAGYGYDLPE